MNIDGIGPNLAPMRTTTVRISEALPVYDAIVNKAPNVNVILSRSAENLAGFEEAYANFALITPEDIVCSFLPQNNLDPDKITQKEVDQTNAIWGKARGQAIEDVFAT